MVCLMTFSSVSVPILPTSPSITTSFTMKLLLITGKRLIYLSHSGTVVERWHSDQEVAGSNPERFYVMLPLNEMMALLGSKV